MLPENLKHTSWFQLQNGAEFHADEVNKIVNDKGNILKIFDFDNNLLASMPCNSEDHLWHMRSQVLDEVRNFNKEVIEEDNTICPYMDWD
jgi:hypothetical protein